MSVQPFVVDIPAATLEDLQQRLATTRLPPGEDAADWEAGTSPAFLRELLAHWRSGYSWAAQQARINALPQFKAEVDGRAVHFVHQRGKGTAPLPIVLAHGWPDSFLRFEKLVPLLADPQAHGASADDAFDVVVPSLPGFGFSDPPKHAGDTFRIGSLWYALMTRHLGYARYGAHGGDWGSTVCEQLARDHGAALAGIHLTDVPFWHAFRPPKDLSLDEQSFLKANQDFQMREGAYAMIQGTRPQTLADALNDSPIGLAAWLIEKFQRWSDCDGDVERRFSKDELLTHVTLYWATGTIGTSFLPYRDFTGAGALRWIGEKLKDMAGRSHKVPAGFALSPKDLAGPPREWAERFYNVQHWTTMPRGGHFAAWEEPQLLAENIRAFFRPLRP